MSNRSPNLHEGALGGSTPNSPYLESNGFESYAGGDQFVDAEETHPVGFESYEHESSSIGSLSNSNRRPGAVRSSGFILVDDSYLFDHLPACIRWILSASPDQSLHLESTQETVPDGQQTLSPTHHLFTQFPRKPTPLVFSSDPTIHSYSKSSQLPPFPRPTVQSPTIIAASVFKPVYPTLCCLRFQTCLSNLILRPGIGSLSNYNPPQNNLHSPSSPPSSSLKQQRQQGIWNWIHTPSLSFHYRLSDTGPFLFSRDTNRTTPPQAPYPLHSLHSQTRPSTILPLHQYPWPRLISSLRFSQAFLSSPSKAPGIMYAHAYEF